MVFCPKNCRYFLSNIIYVHIFVVFALFLLFVLPSSAFAAGFAISDQGATHVGLAGSTTARSDVSSAGFSNPASFLYGKKVRGAANISLLFPEIEHTSNAGQRTQTDAPMSMIPQVHLGSYFETDAGVFGAHAAFFAPFGTTVVWPEGWAGRYESQRTSIQVLELNAGIGYQYSEALSISIGPRFLMGQMETGRAIDVVNSAQDASVLIKSSGNAWGWQASFMSKVFRDITLGISFRSSADFDLSGAAYFQDVPVELSARAHDSRLSIALPTPARLAWGANWEIVDGTSISLDSELFFWDTFETLLIDFEDEAVANVVQERNWNNRTAIRLGFEQRFLERQVAARAGFAWDPSPAPPESLVSSSPDTDRITLGLGFGWLGADVAEGLDFVLDVGFGYTALLERDVANEDVFAGSYRGSILSISLGLGVQY